MNLEDYTTEQLLAELEKRKVSIDEVRFKKEVVADVKWSDLTLVYTIETTKYTKVSFLKIAPFVDGEFCYHEIGSDVVKLLPKCFCETEECIFEYYGEPDVGLKRLEEFGFKMKRDDEFFDW
jgi:hypothetical protein